MLLLDQAVQDAYQLPQTVMVLSTQVSGAKEIARLGSCDISRTYEALQKSGRGTEVAVSPGDDAADYFVKIEKSRDARSDFGGHMIGGQVVPAYEVLEGPFNGVWKNYKYIPNPGFEGKDRITFHVRGEKGREVIVTHFINVVKDAWATEEFNRSGYKKYCPNGMELRKVSESDQGQSFLSTWQKNAEFSSLLANVTQSLTGFQNLAGTAVGNTTGSGL